VLVYAGLVNEDDTPMTDAELDALDADITRDEDTIHAMEAALLAKVRRYRAELNRRSRPPGTVHQMFPPPQGKPEDPGE
jgi:hypothetical protein